MIRQNFHYQNFVPYSTLKGTKAKIYVDTQVAKAQIFKPHSVPFALREKVKKELERLIKEDIIEPVTFSEWAVPIVLVIKEDKE